MEPLVNIPRRLSVVQIRGVVQIGGGGARDVSA
jgi:hypothetical protein